MRLVSELVSVALETLKSVFFVLMLQPLLAQIMANVLLQEISPELAPQTTLARTQVRQPRNVMSDLTATRTPPLQPRHAKLLAEMIQTAQIQQFMKLVQFVKH